MPVTVWPWRSSSVINGWPIAPLAPATNTFMAILLVDFYEQSFAILRQWKGKSTVKENLDGGVWSNDAQFAGLEPGAPMDSARWKFEGELVTKEGIA